MNAECGICKDRFVNFENLCGALCGHVFHHHCITSWFEMGSRTCPQCRKPATKTVKLFFDLVEPSPNDEQDMETLKGINDCLRFKIDQKEAEIKLLKKTGEEAKKNVKRFKTVIEEYESEMRGLNEQLSYHHSQSRALAETKNELKVKTEQLKSYQKKLDRMLNVKALTGDHHCDEVSIRSIGKDLSKEDLIEIICSIKRTQKKLEHSESLLADNLRQADFEVVVLRKNLNQAEAKVKILEQVTEEMKARDRPSTSSTFHESPMDDDFCPEVFFTPDSPPCQVVKPRPTSNGFSKTTDGPIVKKNVSELKDNLKAKPTTIFKTPRIAVTNKLKKNVATLEPEYYNGFGGSARLDKFPQAKLRPCKILNKFK